MSRLKRASLCFQGGVPEGWMKPLSLEGVCSLLFYNFGKIPKWSKFKGEGFLFGSWFEKVEIIMVR